MSTPTPNRLKGFRLVAVVAGGGCAALVVLLIIVGVIVSAANGTLGRGVPEETSTASSSAPEVTTAASESEETAEATPSLLKGPALRRRLARCQRVPHPRRRPRKHLRQRFPGAK